LNHVAVPISSEIPATRALVNAGQQQNCAFPDRCEGVEYEYHFRDMGDGHILWCAYAKGGNGGFCKKITARDVASADAAARDSCRDDPDMGPPPSAYGELWDLDYRCNGTRASRLPVDMALDAEGYVRGQWKNLGQ
jgi:hypothetical protein